MKVAVIVVWRPKNFPAWKGRCSNEELGIPKPLQDDAGAAPYTGVHLASLFPRHWQVTLVHEMARDVDFNMDVDAAFLSTMDFSAPHACYLSSELRKRGVKVIIGGLYPTLNPEYFKGRADAVVVGEAEPVFSQLLCDLEAGTLQPLYVAENNADLSDLPPPNYDLMETNFKVPMAYEAARGCPFTCSFCILSAIRQPFRKRPIASVVRDISAIPSHWNWTQRKYVIFWDSNFGADRKYFRSMCEALAPLKRIWGAETSIDTITEESARLMGKSGCRFLYIGLESLAQDSLTGANKRHNKVKDYKQKLRWLHQNGVLVMSIFLLGLDSDSLEYFDQLPGLIDDVGVDIPVYSFAAPIERTTFYKELRDAGRLLPGNILDGMDGMFLTYKPMNVSADELEVAMMLCMRRSYSPMRVLRRSARAWSYGLWSGFASTSANLFYAPYQLALARTAARRIRVRGLWPGDEIRQPTEKDLPLGDLALSDV